MSSCTLQSLSMIVTTLSNTRLLQAKGGRVQTVHYRSHLSYVTLYAKVTFFAGNHSEWHASSLQAVVVCVHIVLYRIRLS
jgi:hypothetical protein